MQAIKLVAVLALTLTGCQTTRLDPIIVKDTPVAIPTIQPIVLSPVVWIVIPKPNPLYALDDPNYQNLASNLIEIRRYLDEQKAVINLLKGIADQRSQPVAKDGKNGD